MQLAKWGNSLAVRIPAEIVKELGLKEGDELTAETIDGSIRLARKLSIAERLEALSRLPDRFPADFKFNRDEANERAPLSRDASRGHETLPRLGGKRNAAE
jgi:antitoxin MazE